MNDQKQKQLAGLIELLLDGSADDSSRKKIADLLHDDPDAQQWYVEYCQMHAMLAWEHGTLPEVVFDAVPQGQAFNSERVTMERSTRRWQWLAICASILFAVSAGMIVYGPSRSHPVAVTPSGVQSSQNSSRKTPAGVLLSVNQAAWEDSPSNAAAGDLVFDEPLRLQSGTVQIALFGGATITLEGRCQLDLFSGTRGYLRHGNIFVSVQHDDVELEIDTPVGRMIHLGTKFGVSVAETGETDMFVLEGAVELKPIVQGSLIRSSRIVRSGRAMRIQASGRASDLGSEEFESIRNKFEGPGTSDDYVPPPPMIGADGFMVRYVKARSTVITSLADADRLLSGTIPSDEDKSVSGLEYISFRDRRINPNAKYPWVSQPRFSGEQPFPGDEGGFDDDDDDFVILATADIVVQNAWIYSFLVNVDDGARLRIDGNDVIVDDGLHGAQVSIGTVVLSQGSHKLELVAYEHERFCRVELACAAGETRNVNDFSLLRTTSSSRKDD